MTTKNPEIVSDVALPPFKIFAGGLPRRLLRAMRLDSFKILQYPFQTLTITSCMSEFVMAF